MGGACMKKHMGEYLGYSLHIITFITYFILLLIREVPSNLKWLQYPGFIIFLLGIFFLVSSVICHHRNRGSALVDKGVYGIVRHPMYLGAILLFVAMVCFLPIWLMGILATLNVFVVYRFLRGEEHNNIEKYGQDYIRYMDSVPQVNFITGLFRWIKRIRNQD
jgi:protein-S-isoprenylcysteine O-methyltransferase Ste14